MPVQRNTIQRMLVLNAVKQLANHPTSDNVYEFIHKNNPAVSRSTVYRNLNLLCEDGLLLRIPVPNSADHVDHTCTPHYHVLCERCGNIFDAAGGEALSDEQDEIERLWERAAGGDCEITGCMVLFTGICSRCKQAQSDETERPEAPENNGKQQA